MKVSVVRALGALALFCGVAVIAFFVGRADPGGAAVSRLQMQATPGVVTAIRDIARIETTQFHIEKVVEVSDAQSRLWGMLEAKDALLLVAVGDVIAGVDLAKVREGDVRVDEATRSVHVSLPAPEIVASTLDERATHVYSRATDALAARNEQLEGAARRTAEEQMRKAALEAGILDRARTSADRTLRVLLRSLGYERVDLDWADRG
ncbi:MAG: DUF4230 domain-containing protein [Myxococcota bacterium]|nr:DUF4230 domain-containing protein [Myxococcota bacterium]